MFMCKQKGKLLKRVESSTCYDCFFNNGEFSCLLCVRDFKKCVLGNYKYSPLNNLIFLKEEEICGN